MFLHHLDRFIMQYILSEEEYQALREKQSYDIKMSKSKLQQLCTKIADEMPVNAKWRTTEPAPWGCILTETEYEWYCDNCPVQSICPNEYKHYSK